jgi:ribonuclease-3
LVSRDALHGRAVALDLGVHLSMGRGEEATGGRTRSSTLADAFEALIGAIYLDSDLETARKFILQEMRDELQRVIEEPVDVNPKGELQELLQSLSGSSPVYRAISAAGPEHEKTFVVEVLWEGKTLGGGAGRSKKQAETAAASDALIARLWENAAPAKKKSVKPARGAPRGLAHEAEDRQQAS